MITLIIKGQLVQLQPVIPTGSIRLKEFTLCAEVTFLESTERLKIENEKKDFIITQVQQNIFDVAQNVQTGNFKMDFINPVKELYFVIRRGR